MPQAAPVSHLQELDLAVDHEALDTQPAGKRAGDRKRPTSRTASPLRIPALLSGEHQRLGNAIARPPPERRAGPPRDLVHDLDHGLELGAQPIDEFVLRLVDHGALRPVPRELPGPSFDQPLPCYVLANY